MPGLQPSLIPTGGIGIRMEVGRNSPGAQDRVCFPDKVQLAALAASDDW